MIKIRTIIGNVLGVITLILVMPFWISRALNLYYLYPYGLAGIIYASLAAIGLSLVATCLAGPKWLASTVLAFLMLVLARNMFY